MGVMLPVWAAWTKAEGIQNLVLFYIRHSRIHHIASPFTSVSHGEALAGFAHGKASGCRFCPDARGIFNRPCHPNMPLLTVWECGPTTSAPRKFVHAHRSGVPRKNVKHSIIMCINQGVCTAPPPHGLERAKARVTPGVTYENIDVIHSLQDCFVKERVGKKKLATLLSVREEGSVARDDAGRVWHRHSTDNQVLAKEISGCEPTPRGLPPAEGTHYCKLLLSSSFLLWEREQENREPPPAYKTPRNSVSRRPASPQYLLPACLLSSSLRVSVCGSKGILTHPRSPAAAGVRRIRKMEHNNTTPPKRRREKRAKTEGGSEVVQ